MVELPPTGMPQGKNRIVLHTQGGNKRPERGAKLKAIALVLMYQQRTIITWYRTLARGPSITGHSILLHALVAQIAAKTKPISQVTFLLTCTLFTIRTYGVADPVN